MKPSEYTVLDFLGRTRLSLPPSVLHYNMVKSGHEIGYSTVKANLASLSEHNLVTKEKEEEGYYAITDRGIAYLEGELDPDEID
ncbi:PadR family transcriptional regulator [Haloprofundus halobius]|uniref:PadR family transcriptional regulator n=1 Tax=Haloprofundus halobius TaxID=2876194 RepID=UPI001CCA7F4D|nr:PadR family transcriptional regulator [Haloprofundus halobius]